MAGTPPVPEPLTATLGDDHWQHDLNDAHGYHINIDSSYRRDYDGPHSGYRKSFLQPGGRQDWMGLTSDYVSATRACNLA